MMWVFGVCLLALSQQFSDVPKGHWAFAAVGNVTSRGYMHGDNTGAFRGDKPVTRYEFAVALDRFVRDVHAGLTAAPKGGSLNKPGAKPTTAPKKKPPVAPSGEVVLPPGAKRAAPAMSTPKAPGKAVKAASSKPADKRVGVPPTHWAYKALRHLYDGKYLPPNSPIFSASTETLTSRQVGLAFGQIAVRLADMRSDPKEPQ